MGHGGTAATVTLVRPPDGSSAILPDWRVEFYADESPNDNDIRIQVPRNEEWHILNIWVEYTSDATVGDRQLVVEIRDWHNDVEAQVRAGEVQAASLTRYYNFGPGLADLTDFRDTNWLMTPIPPTWIFGHRAIIRVYDNNNVSAADDMEVHLSIGRRLVG